MKKTATAKKSSLKAVAKSRAASWANRRKEWRFDLPLPTIIEGKLPQGEQFKETTTLENISSTGAYFTMDTGVSVGSKLNIFINLPKELTEGKPVRLHLGGITVRLEEPDKKGKKQGVAVRFHKDFRFVSETEPEKNKNA